MFVWSKFLWAPISRNLNKIIIIQILNEIIIKIELNNFLGLRVWSVLTLCSLFSPNCFYNLSSVCPLPAPVPVWGTEEAAVPGHGTDHLTGQQLVSALPINTLIPARCLINNQLKCHVLKMLCVNFQFNYKAAASSITCSRGLPHGKWAISGFYTPLNVTRFCFFFA